MLILSIQSYGYLWYRAFSAILSPIVKTVHFITKYFSELFYSFKELREARDENKVLKEKVMWQEYKIGKLLVENLFLKQLYDFEEEPDFYNYIAKSSILGMDTPAYSSKLILPLGKGKGIKEKYICITPQGVVGKIIKVDTFNSYLLPIVNSEAVISGVCERTSVHGVLMGDGTGFLQMKYLPPYSDILEGDIIYTDCWDFTFPYGLKIGTISKIERKSDELIVKVKPFVDFSKLNYVYIIKGAQN